MKDIITRHKSGEHIGICSVCSAHPLVIEAALRFDLSTNNKVLIEATSNRESVWWLHRHAAGRFPRLRLQHRAYRRFSGGAHYSWRRPS